MIINHPHLRWRFYNILYK